MDLEKIKNTIHREPASEETEEGLLRQQILTSLISMYNLMENFNQGWQQKMKDTVEEFLSKLIALLVKSDFQVTRECATKEVPEGTCLTAVYQTLTIQIKNINYEGNSMEVTSSADHNTKFFFGTPEDVPKYYLWKNYVDICGTKLNTLSSDVKEVYRHFVRKETCLDELYIIQDEIDGNINHYKRGILDLDFVQLCIYNKNNKCIYHSFEDFWKDL